MKQKHMLVLALLLICVSLIFSGCSTLQSPTCVEDNFCAINEKTRGGCKDCLPDFSIQQDTMKAYYDQSNGAVRAEVCVENKNGEYTDGVQVNWGLSSTKEWKGDSQKQWVYFDAPDVQGSFSLNARKGAIDQWSNIQFANAHEQVNCFSYEFYDVASAPYYYVLFQINGDQTVEEKTFDNNAQWYYAEGRVANYPGYLIEEDFDSLKNSYAYGGYTSTWYYGDSQKAAYTEYYAGYSNYNVKPSQNGWAGVFVFENSDIASGVVKSWTNGYDLIETKDGAKVYEYTDKYTVSECEKDGDYGTWYGSQCPEDYIQTGSWEQSYATHVWTSNEKVVYTSAQNADDVQIGLLNAYLNLHPSTVYANATNSSN